ASFGGTQIAPIYTQADQDWINMGLLPEYQQNPEAISRLYLATPRAASSQTSNIGSLVPLSAVATVRRGTQPLSVNHFGQLPAVTLSFNLPQGVPLSTA